ncbi:hypothetical protein EV189_0620 [Motilibacter rhizosphaerae]|uniref:Uncharacterized protein n=1 Tax=Motilibacter rhizosphaerae TaxID=598652 RepID=A0A4V2F529_9ACTN|nr:hypothetical protein [Motilibacter rhizosphaerae]RZS91379.1 hypothetical protein EV189_0620 [Motilibacter rhizosphaerae]
MDDAVVTGLLVVWLVCWGVLLHSAEPEVSFRRLDRFVERCRLGISEQNGPVVVRYLTTARRWRTAGAVAGLAVGLGRGLPTGTPSVDTAWILAGWFVGAALAEWRVTGPSAERARAALVARERRRYAAGWVSALPLVLAVAAVVTAVLDVIAWGRLGGQALVPCASLAVVSVATVVLVRTAVGRALARRQPGGLAPDVLAADEAVRHRSVHVLHGTGTALVGIALGSLLRLHPDVPGLVADLVTLGAALLGWGIGLRSVPLEFAEEPYARARAEAAA